MAFFRVMARAIGKIWGFLTKMMFLVIFIAFILFIATVITPENVIRAIEIAKGLFQ